MSKSTSDNGECSRPSSFQEDLSKLVVWAHTHGTICNQTPALEFMQSMDYLSNDNSVLWMCRDGHAYHWHYGKLHDTGEEETEAVGRKKRLTTSESLARESSFEEMRLKVTPSSSEMGQADCGSTGSRGTSQGVTEQKCDSAHTRNNKPRGNQDTITSFSAEEQHFSMSGSGVQTGKQDMKSKSDEDVQIISDDEQCKADEDNQGDRISQDNVSDAELHVLPCQKLPLHQPAASQSAAFTSTTKPPLTRDYILQALVKDTENLRRNTLGLSPSTSAGPVAETSGARSLLRSASPEVCFKALPGTSTEARPQFESKPSIFFEFQATADIQQHLQMSSPECGTLEAGSSMVTAESEGEDSRTSESGQTPCSSAFQSPESHSPAASNRDVLKKQKVNESCTAGNIKAFKEWLNLNHPSERREVHTLPPADLDHYLVSFFSSVKKSSGMDFSVSSLKLFQRNIQQYLKSHNYQYNILKGPEFRASQEVLISKHLNLCQKEHMWSVVENLTDEDVGKLLQNGFLSKTNPMGLMHFILVNLIRGFGASTHYQVHHRYWGQVVLKRTKGGLEYLEWKDDLSSRGKQEKQSKRLFAKPEDPEKCPVASYKEYARRRPKDMLNDSDPLYLVPKSLYSVCDKVWYCKKAIPKGKIDMILRVLSKEVRKVVEKTGK